MAEAQRKRRIEAEIQRVLSELIAREVKDPRVGNVTITAVNVAADMGAARVYFTPFASINPHEEVRIGLTHAGGFLRGALVGHGEEQAGAESGDVVRLAARAEVAEVVADLVGDAERFAVRREDFLVFLKLPGVNRAELERDGKCGCRFLAENIDDLV